MKKIAATAAFTVLFSLCLAPLIQAQTSPYYETVQFSLFNPWQIHHESTSIQGVRLNLFYGVNYDMTGLDIGLGNRVLSDMTGIQIGLINLVDRNFSGLQWGAINSVRGTACAVQIAYYNYAGTLDGIQAGFINYSKNASGIQIAFINAADRLKGLQIGLLNFNFSGEPVGFFWGDSSPLFFPFINFSFKF